MNMILDDFPDLARVRNPRNGRLPIHTLCTNGNMNVESSLGILKRLVRDHPRLSRKQVKRNTGRDSLFRRHGEDFPIHLACQHMSFDFCKAILRMYPASVSRRALHFHRESSIRGSSVLPFHLACKFGPLALVKYLLDKYPQALSEHTEDEDYANDLDDADEVGINDRIEANERNVALLKKGDFALHLAASRASCHEKLEIIDFILEKDPEAAGRVGKWGNLPLHVMCMYDITQDLSIMKRLFHANPRAIHAENIFGRLPIHHAIRYFSENDLGCLSFLARQLPYSLGALDSRGISCAHYACKPRLIPSDLSCVKKLEMIADIFPEAFRSMR